MCILQHRGGGVADLQECHRDAAPGDKIDVADELKVEDKVWVKVLTVDVEQQRMKMEEWVAILQDGGNTSVLNHEGIEMGAVGSDHHSLLPAGPQSRSLPSSPSLVYARGGPRGRARARTGIA